MSGPSAQEALANAERSMATESKGESAIADYRKKHLSINEILFLLKKRVQPGREVPSQFDFPPWRLPKDTTSSASSVINQILSESTKIQSSTVPKSGDFDDFILSNSSMAVAGLMKNYLFALSKQVSPKSK